MTPAYKNLMPYVSFLVLLPIPFLVFAMAPNIDTRVYILLLRVVVILSSIVAIALNYYNNMPKRWLVIPVIIMLLFNPFGVIYFARELWVIIDIVVAIIFCINFIKIYPKSIN